MVAIWSRNVLLGVSTDFCGPARVADLGEQVAGGPLDWLCYGKGA